MASAGYQAKKTATPTPTFYRVTPRNDLIKLFNKKINNLLIFGNMLSADKGNLISGLQIISRLAPVKLSGQTYFCSDISHFWPDKHRLRLIAIKVPPHPFT